VGGNYWEELSPRKLKKNDTKEPGIGGHALWFQKKRNTHAREEKYKGAHQQTTKYRFFFSYKKGKEIEN